MLFKFLNWLIGWPEASFCDHKFEVIQNADVYDFSSGETPIGTKYTLQCKNCGRMKAFKNY